MCPLPRLPKLCKFAPSRGRGSKLLLLGFLRGAAAVRPLTGARIETRGAERLGRSGSGSPPHGGAD